MNIYHALVCMAMTTTVYMGALFSNDANIPTNINQMDSLVVSETNTTNETQSDQEPTYDGMVLCSNIEHTTTDTNDNATSKDPETIEAIQYETLTIEDTLSYENVAAVSYKIEYPKFSGEYSCLEKINEYYKNKAETYLEHVRTDLYPNAVSLYKDTLELGAPIPTYVAQSSFKVTNTAHNILSIYTENYEFTGGAHGNTTRDSQNWNLQTCKCLLLEDLYKDTPNYQSMLLDRIHKEMAKNKDAYFQEDDLAKQTFNPNNYYFTDNGMIIYYQQYDIAPYAAGIVEFFIPYSFPQKETK